MGIALVLGTTKFWIISYGIITLLIFYRSNNYLDSLKTNKTIIALVILFTIIASYSPSPLKAIYYAVSIYICSIILKSNPSKIQVLSTIIVVSVVQLLWGSIEYVSGIHRIHGATQNASAMGVMALSFLPQWYSFLVIGFSLSRTALLGTGLFAILINRKIVWFGLSVAILLHVLVTIVADPARLTLADYSLSWIRREKTIDGTTDEKIVDIGSHTRNLRLFGYGHNGYVLSTGLIQPHNIFVLSIWESGIIAIPIWAYIILLWWKIKNPYLLILLPLSLLVDEWWTDVEGVFAIALMHLMTRDLRVGFDIRSIFARMRVMASG